MSLSAETMRLQDDWSTTLERTVHELSKVCNQAAKSYETFVSSMVRVGHLYASCGELMASANTPSLAMSRPVTEATEARALTARLMASTEHWWRSSDEQTFLNFLKTQRDEWQRWRREATRTHQHNNSRKDVVHVMAELHTKVEGAPDKDATVVRRLRQELEGLKGELETLNGRVQRDLANNVKLCSNGLVKYGDQLMSLMSASGYSMTCNFQGTGSSKASQVRAEASVFAPPAAAAAAAESQVFSSSVEQCALDNYSLSQSGNSDEDTTQVPTQPSRVISSERKLSRTP